MHEKMTDEELIAACKAHDKEEAAQMGEPSPWEVNKDDIDPEWVSGRVAAMRCAMAALPSGVRVTKLEWREIYQRRSDEDPHLEWTGEYEVSTPFGIWEIGMGFGSDAYYWSVSDPFGNDIGSDFTSAEEAKAAAQSDYERRILSALEGEGHE